MASVDFPTSKEHLQWFGILDRRESRESSAGWKEARGLKEKSVLGGPLVNTN